MTNLNDSGPGSLRAGVEDAPSSGRTILFKISGIINLETGLSINKSNITIAGQTAPGDGITIRGHTIYIGEPPPRKPGSSLANNIVIRHIHARLGVGVQGVDQTDNIWANSGSDIVLDHISSSWSADEALSATRDVRNLSVQNSLLTEALNATGHGFGGLIDSGYDTTYSYHHNLYAHNVSRNPRPGTSDPDPGFEIDFRNNVLYNWGYEAGYLGADDKNIKLNYVNNYLVAGPDSTQKCAMRGADAGDASIQIYQSGNKIDLNKNGLVDGTDTAWAMFCDKYFQHQAAFDVPAVTTDSAESAYLEVLAQGGALPWRRDAVDKRIVGTVRTQTGKVIDSQEEVGGYPTVISEPAPIDSDSDGMPDFWEQAVGLNPHNPADRNNTGSAGYTALENYLNWLADGHAATDRNGSVDVDLNTLNGGLDHLTFTLAGATHGAVRLLDDGHTARFTPTSDYAGPAGFAYTVIDSVTGFGFGPVSVGVLAKASSGPAPTVQPSTPADGGCTASYRILNAWSGAWQGEVTVLAGTSAISGWSVSWNLDGGQSLSNVWNGRLTTNGSTMSVRNESYNGFLQPSSSTSFGFIGSGAPSPASLHCSGVAPPARDELTGWAAMPGKGLATTTGGGSGSPVEVRSANELTAALAGSEPRVIHVVGSVRLARKMYAVGSNKSIIGLGAGAELVGGGLFLNGVSNVIIRNLTVRDAFVPGDWGGTGNSTDLIRVENSHHFWLDHSKVQRGADGMVDMRFNSDYITLSWNIFADHNKAGFVTGNANEIQPKATIHHNWYRNLYQRSFTNDNALASHVYNNYFDGVMLYAMLSRGAANVAAENNYFRDTNDPLVVKDPESEMVERGNIFGEGTTGVHESAGLSWEPTDFYQYTLDPAYQVPALVKAQAGPEGGWPQAPSTITVALDGSGDFGSVTHALGSIPPDQKAPVTIVVKPGIYFEVTRVWRERNNVTIRGATGNPADVVMTAIWGVNDPKFYHGTFGVEASPTLAVYADNVTLKDLTVENTSTAPGPKIALRALGKNLSLNNVVLNGDYSTH